MLPVGSREEAARLLARLIADPPEERLPAPAAARFKSPLRYHHLSLGHNDTCVVTTSGRLTRITAWTPVGKLQSVRRVQGPVQRRLGLASVRLDTAGRNIRAAIRDRETAEADRALSEVVRLSRIARRA